MKNEIPVVSLFFQALILPTKHWWAVLKVASPFILSSLLLTFAPHISVAVGYGNWSLFGPIALVLGLASLITLIMAIVSCHRIFLLGPAETKLARPFRWSGNEFRFALWWLAAFITFAVCSIVYLLMLSPILTLVNPLISESVIATSIVMTLFMLPLYIVFVRFSVVLPAAAIGKANIGLGWAWGYSWNNSWRLVLLLGILPFIIDLISDQIPSVDTLWFDILSGAIWLITGVISIALLSLSFHALSELEEQRDAQVKASDTPEAPQESAAN